MNIFVNHCELNMQFDEIIFDVSTTFISLLLFYFINKLCVMKYIYCCVLRWTMLHILFGSFSLLLIIQCICYYILHKTIDLMHTSVFLRLQACIQVFVPFSKFSFGRSICICESPTYICKQFK